MAFLFSNAPYFGYFWFVESEKFDQVNDKEPLYGGRIKGFHSFEEENDFVREEWSKLTPEQCFHQYFLILSSWYSPEVIARSNPYQGCSISGS